MSATQSAYEFYIADLSIFTYTYMHKPGRPMWLDWSKLADQDTHLPGARIEIPDSLVEMAFEAPDALRMLMLALKPSLQQHGFEQVKSNLREYAANIPRFARTEGEGLPWTLDQASWRYLVRYSYGIAYRDIHPLHIRLAQEIVEALTVGKQESRAVKRKLFALVKRPLKGCHSLWRGPKRTVLQELEDFPIVRLLDGLRCTLLVWGDRIGFCALGSMQRIDLSAFGSEARRVTEQMRRSLSDYSGRKRELAEELFTESVPKMLVAISGATVGLTAIAVIFSEPAELTAKWLKDLAEASAAGAAGVYFLVDGGHFGDR